MSIYTIYILGSDVQGVQVLTLVLVHALDLAVKDGARVDDLTGALGQVVGKILLVGQLDLVQALEHGLVVLVLVQLGQVGSIVLVAVTDT